MSRIGRRDVLQPVGGDGEGILHILIGDIQGDLQDLALGVSAVGVYAGGVAAIAAKIAVAVSAVAPTAVGEFASGSHVLLWGDGLTAPEVQTFLLEHHPDLWRPLLRLLTEIGAHIK